MEAPDSRLASSRIVQTKTEAADDGILYWQWPPGQPPVVALRKALVHAAQQAGQNRAYQRGRRDQERECSNAYDRGRADGDQQARAQLAVAATSPGATGPQSSARSSPLNRQQQQQQPQQQRQAQQRQPSQAAVGGQQQKGEQNEAWIQGYRDCMDEVGSEGALCPTTTTTTACPACPPRPPATAPDTLPPAWTSSLCDDVDITCTITLDQMRDPYINLKSGHSYEGDAIKKWVRDNENDPQTRAVTQLSDLAPNRALKSLVDKCRSYKLIGG